MAQTPKKFLDAAGLQHFADKLNDFPTNEILGTVIDAIGDELDEKQNTVTIPIHIDLVVEETCASCGGTGEQQTIETTTTCETCGGSGSLDSESSDCPDCSGSGYVNTGEQCGGCGGTGYIDVTEPCPECGGTGEIIIDAEADIREPCSTCNGSGEIIADSMECSDCGGTGWTQVPCSTCGGAGVIEGSSTTCPDCGGSGEITETSTEPCVNCSGTGTLVYTLPLHRLFTNNATNNISTCRLLKTDYAKIFAALEENNTCILTISYEDENTLDLYDYTLSFSNTIYENGTVYLIFTNFLYTNNGYGLILMLPVVTNLNNISGDYIGGTIIQSQMALKAELNNLSSSLNNTLTNLATTVSNLDKINVIEYTKHAADSNHQEAWYSCDHTYAEIDAMDAENYAMLAVYHDGTDTLTGLMSYNYNNSSYEAIFYWTSTEADIKYVQKIISHNQQDSISLRLAYDTSPFVVTYTKDLNGNFSCNQSAKAIHDALYQGRAGFCIYDELTQGDYDEGADTYDTLHHMLTTAIVYPLPGVISLGTVYILLDPSTSDLGNEIFNCTISVLVHMSGKSNESITYTTYPLGSGGGLSKEDKEFQVFSYKIDPNITQPLATTTFNNMTFYQLDTRPIPFHDDYEVISFFWDDNISSDYQGASLLSLTDLSSQGGYGKIAELRLASANNDATVYLLFAPDKLYDVNDNYDCAGLFGGLWLASPDIPINTLFSTFQAQGLKAYIYIVGKGLNIDIIPSTPTIRRTIHVGGNSFYHIANQQYSYATGNPHGLVLISPYTPNLDTISKYGFSLITLDSYGKQVNSSVSAPCVSCASMIVSSSIAAYEWTWMHNNEIGLAKSDQGLWMRADLLDTPLLITWEEDNLLYKKIAINNLSDVYTSSVSPAEGQTLVYNSETDAMFNQPYTFDYPSVDWKGHGDWTFLPQVRNKPIKYALSKGIIEHGLHNPYIVDNNNTIALCQMDYCSLETDFVFDTCAVVKDSSSGNIVALANHDDTINVNGALAPKFNIPFEVNDTAYILHLFAHPEYSQGLFDGVKGPLPYFVLYDTTNETPIWQNPFDIDIYFLYPENVDTQKISFTRKIQNSIFYDFDTVKAIMNSVDINFNTSFAKSGFTPSTGWLKISDYPLLYNDKDTLMCLGRNYTNMNEHHNEIQYYDNSSNSFFCDDDIIQIMNYGLSHTNVNNYDYIQITEDGQTYYPLFANDVTGCYVYLPVILQNNYFNSGLMITYEVDNPLIKLIQEQLAT